MVYPQQLNKLNKQSWVILLPTGMCGKSEIIITDLLACLALC